jgi:hypothetical protein
MIRIYFSEINLSKADSCLKSKVSRVKHRRIWFSQTMFLSYHLEGPACVDYGNLLIFQKASYRNLFFSLFVCLLFFLNLIQVSPSFLYAHDHKMTKLCGFFFLLTNTFI